MSSELVRKQETPRGNSQRNLETMQVQSFNYVEILSQPCEINQQRTLNLRFFVHKLHVSAASVHDTVFSLRQEKLKIFSSHVLFIQSWSTFEIVFLLENSKTQQILPFTIVQKQKGKTLFGIIYSIEKLEFKTISKSNEEK